MVRLACRAATLATALAVSGCVAVTTPARTDESYRAKAGAAATSIRDAVETALLTAEAGGQGRIPASTAAVLLSEAERDAGGKASFFAGLQPPTSAAEGVRRQLLELADQAEDGLTELRIAARRGQLDALPEKSTDLRQVADDLKAFAEAQK